LFLEHDALQEKHQHQHHLHNIFRDLLIKHARCCTKIQALLVMKCNNVYNLHGCCLRLVLLLRAAAAATATAHIKELIPNVVLRSTTTRKVDKLYAPFASHTVMFVTTCFDFMLCCCLNE